MLFYPLIEGCVIPVVPLRMFLESDECSIIMIETKIELLNCIYE